jgi:ribonuclease J
VGENGTVVDLTAGIASQVGQLDIGFVYVDGSTVGEITEADLKDRRILAEEGFISIFIAMDAKPEKSSSAQRFTPVVLLPMTPSSTMCAPPS